MVPDGLHAGGAKVGGAEVGGAEVGGAKVKLDHVECCARCFSSCMCAHTVQVRFMPTHTMNCR